MDGTASQPSAGRRRIIERPRLTRLLDESAARVKLLVAPPGYGKTTLARQWLADKPLTVWVTASPAAADVALLLSDLCRAVGRVEPGRDDRLRERLAVTADPEAEWPVLAEILAEDLESLGSDAWLVIDDYHSLAESEVAEAVIGRIVDAGVCSAFIVSRTRPGWVSARQILYGEVLELGQNALAMTSEEAESAFSENARIGPGLVHLAQGWPAVLALAALAPDARVPELGEALPETLHEFFAEELYRCLDVSVQRGLTRIAVADIDDVETAREFFDDVEQDLEQAAAVGWITRPSPDEIELHPLLRSFLRSRLERDEPEEFRAACESTARLLIDRGRWDEAARLIADQKMYPLLIPLLEASLEPLLLQGRLATLREWVQNCTQHGLDSPVVRLAKAELALRAGQFFEAEVLATSLTELDAPERLGFRALALAGRAAHIGSRELHSLEYFRAARARASTREEQDTAALGELLAAIELELPEADGLFAELDRVEPRTPERRLALIDRALSLDTRFGRPPRLNQARSEHQLLNDVKDPLGRCAFRNVFAYCLVQSGSLQEAEALLAEQHREVAVYRLAFVAAYADIIEALIRTIEGDFGAAIEILDRVEPAARAKGDWFLLANVIAVRSRALIGSGVFEEAVANTLQELGPVPRSMAAELLATRALALACAKRSEDALADADEAVQLSQCTEAIVLSECARAVVAVNDSHLEAFAVVRDALSLCRRLNSIDAFIAALRGCPDMGALLVDVHETRRALAPLLAVSNETKRYESRATTQVAGAGSWRDLTKREQEVLGLVASGITNAQIADLLFITESTAKVHVHHILKKLGVSSRTAAALRVPPSHRATRPPPSVGSSEGPD